MKVYQFFTMWLIGQLIYLTILAAVITGTVYAVMWALRANGVI